MVQKQQLNDMVADLTWAELYTIKIRKELKTIIPIVKKSLVGPELLATAAELRTKLESTNQTITEIKTLVGFH